MSMQVFVSDTNILNRQKQHPNTGTVAAVFMYVKIR